MGGYAHLPNDCTALKCKLYPYRLGKGGGGKTILIRKYCLECVGTYPEVKNCTETKCPFYNFRLGSIPDLPKNLHSEVIDAPNFNDQGVIRDNIAITAKNRL